MRGSLPHPNPPLIKGREQESRFSRENSSHFKLKIVNDNLDPPLSKGRLGGVKISALKRLIAEFRSIHPAEYSLN
jgi:hypothetical protein